MKTCDECGSIVEVVYSNDVLGHYEYRCDACDYMFEE